MLTSVIVNVQQAAPGVTWPVPAPISFGTALSAAQLDATASVPGTFVYAPPTGAILGAGTQALSVTFTPSDAINYSPVDQTVSLVVIRRRRYSPNLSSPTSPLARRPRPCPDNSPPAPSYPAGDSVSVTVDGVSLTGTIDASGHFSVSVSTAALSAGSYTITYAFSGDANFTAVSATGTLPVSPRAGLAATGVDVMRLPEHRLPPRLRPSSTPIRAALPRPTRP